MHDKLLKNFNAGYWRPKLFKNEDNLTVNNEKDNLTQKIMTIVSNRWRMTAYKAAICDALGFLSQINC